MKPKIDMTRFNELIRNQFVYGGQKYKLTDRRESTDELFDAHGKSWLFGTCEKYCYRYQNLARERDLLKIATYMFIIWLKKGFFVTKEGLQQDSLDTTVEMKEKYFPDFIKNVDSVLLEWYSRNILAEFENRSDEEKFKFISKVLRKWSLSKWSDIDDSSIVGIYFACFLIWFPKYSREEKHDEDTGNAT